MKLAATTTANVMDGLSHLPGVATSDWCDRAANALSRIHHPAWVGACLARLDARGALTDVEVSGAAASSPEFAQAGGGGAPAPAGRTVDLGRIRQSYRDGEWLGWSPSAMQDNLWFVGSAAQAGLLARKGESPLARRWSDVELAEVLLGAVNVPGAPGRMLIIEIASHDPALRESAPAGAALAAVLPILQKRVLSALGAAPADKSAWLTPREEVVLWQLVAGKKVPQIAQELHRSVYTVHDHVKSLHRKLGASNRGQLVARALGHLGPLVAGGGGGANAHGESESQPQIKTRPTGGKPSRSGNG